LSIPTTLESDLLNTRFINTDPVEAKVVKTWLENNRYGPDGVSDVLKTGNARILDVTGIKDYKFESISYNLDPKPETANYHVNAIVFPSVDRGGAAKTILVEVLKATAPYIKKPGLLLRGIGVYEWPVPATDEKAVKGSTLIVTNSSTVIKLTRSQVDQIKSMIGYKDK